MEEQGRKVRMQEVWMKWERKNPRAVSIEGVEHHKDKLRSLVISPVDKYGEEGEIM